MGLLRSIGGIGIIPYFRAIKLDQVDFMSEDVLNNSGTYLVK